MNKNIAADTVVIRIATFGLVTVTSCNLSVHMNQLFPLPYSELEERVAAQMVDRGLAELDVYGRLGELNRMELIFLYMELTGSSI